MKRKRYYMAYGSNLSVDQMAYRCPDAKVAGMGILHDWKLVFKRHADIVPCPGSYVPVVIWDISETDEDNLDVYEGYPSYYIKQELPITMTNLVGKNPKRITAMVYTMTEGKQTDVPSSGYYQTLIEGYARFGFDRHLLEQALEEAKEATRYGEGA